MMRKILIIAFLFFVILAEAFGQKSYTTLKKYSAKESFQVVAVDSTHFYAIDSRAIGKYKKQFGKKIDR